MRVLVVEDEYVSRTKIKALLQPYGDCDAAPTGRIALELVKYAHQEGVPYTLVTMDILLPDIKGQEVVKIIRDWEAVNQVPGPERATILMVTALKDIRDVASSYYEGCEGYINKPVTAEKIRTALTEAGLVS